MQMKTLGALAASAALCACSVAGPRPSPAQAKLEVKQETIMAMSAHTDHNKEKP